VHMTFSKPTSSKTVPIGPHPQTLFLSQLLINASLAVRVRMMKRMKRTRMNWFRSVLLVILNQQVLVPSRLQWHTTQAHGILFFRQRRLSIVGMYTLTMPFQNDRGTSPLLQDSSQMRLREQKKKAQYLTTASFNFFLLLAYL